MSLELQLRAGLGDLTIDVSLGVEREVVALLGPNGAGKTTLLHLVLGVRAPRAGRVAIDGDVLYDGALGVDRPTELRGIGYVPQDCGLFPHMTALDNVAFALGARGVSRAQARAQAATLLTEQGLQSLAGRYAALLSGGERQRVALVRALAAAPRVLLLDEPLASVDIRARRAMRRSLRDELVRLALPTVVVTHSIADAAALGSRIAVMDGGRIVQQGALEDLRRNPANELVADLTSGD